MTKFAILMLGGLILLALLGAAPASAQATRTWVSGVGDDANPCNRTAPCKTFAGAISKTAAGGEINVLDPGGFGGVTVTKSITISSESTEAGVLVSGTNGITVNAGPNDVVILRGLDISGVGRGLAGIKVLAAGAVQIEKCVIRQFNAAGTNGFGISFTPSAASELYVSDTFITNNGVAAISGGGIQIRPTGSGGASFIITNVRMDNNSNGFIVDGNGGTGAIRGSIVRSSASGNTGDGITAVSGGIAVSVMVSNSVFSNNSANGMRFIGAGTVGVINQNTVTANATGVTFTAPAQLLTYNNNNAAQNTVSDGTTSGAAPTK